MTEEVREEPVTEVQPEAQAADQQEQQEERTVPLKALEEERAKRKENEYQAKEMARKLELYEQYMQNMQKKQQEEDYDDFDDEETQKPNQDALKAQVQASIEQQYANEFPDRLKAIQEHLPKILEKRPWLKPSIASAQNRVSQMWTILQDYRHEIDETEQLERNHQRMQENSRKPGNINSVGKPARQSRQEMLKEYAGKPGWRELRAKIRRGEV